MWKTLGLGVSLVALMMGAATVWAQDDVDADADADAEARAADLVEVELSTVGVDMRLRAPVVLLRDVQSEQVVPIWVGLAEAQAIYRALREIPMPRPMTHDLLADVVEQLGGRVEELVVHDLREGTYHAVLRLVVVGESGESGEVREVDARPSDGMALALRTGARILVTQRILDDVPPFDFAIPEEMEPVVRTLGITVVRISDEDRQRHDLPQGEPGVRVSSVTGDARERGLRSDDLILSVNGESVSDPMAFFQSAQEAMRNGRVSLIAWRDGEMFEVRLDVVAPQPQRPSPNDQEERIQV